MVLKREGNYGVLLAALLTGMVLGPQVGMAATGETELAAYDLDPLVVTATRTEKRELEVPASTEVLNHKKIVESGATNAMEALSKVNGFEAKSYFPGGAPFTTMTPEINIRGYGNGTLVMVNGNPINLNNKYVIDAIPAEDIERIEIVKGSGAIMYGSDAMGGVVNIITKKAGHNSVTAGIGNFGQRKYNLSVGNEKFKVNYDYKKWGEVNDLSASARPATKTAYQYSQDQNSKENFGLGYNFNDRLSFQFNHYDSSVDYHRSLILSGKANQWRNSYTKQDLAQLNYNDKDWKGHVWWTKNKIDYYGGSKMGVYDDSTHTRTENSTYGADLQKDFQLNKNSLLTVGTNFKRETYTPDIDKGVKVDNEKSRNNMALFAQLDQKLTPKDNLIVSGRGTWTRGAWNDQNYHNFSAAGQYLHKLSEDQSVYVSAAQSFIMPTFSQMYPTGLAAGDPNPDLKPQKGVNYELGYKALQGSHTWKLALFHMTVDDNITYAWKDDKYYYKNEEFRNTGLEGSLNVAVSDRLNYNLGFTVQNPESKVSNNAKKLGWQRKFGRYQLNGGVDYKWHKLTAGISGSYIWDRYSSPSASDSYSIRPYFLTTLTAVYSPDKHSDLSLVVDNILNREDNMSNTMSNNGVYYSTPTNFLLSYTYKF